MTFNTPYRKAASTLRREELRAALGVLSAAFTFGAYVGILRALPIWGN